MQRERERESQADRLHTVSAEPEVGLELTNCEITSRAEIKSWALNRLSHPGAPPMNVFDTILRTRPGEKRAYI